jgi:hypothetical protein
MSNIFRDSVDTSDFFFESRPQQVAVDLDKRKKQKNHQTTVVCSLQKIRSNIANFSACRVREHISVSDCLRSIQNEIWPIIENFVHTHTFLTNKTSNFGNRRKSGNSHSKLCEHCNTNTTIDVIQNRTINQGCTLRCCNRIMFDKLANDSSRLLRNCPRRLLFTSICHFFIIYRQ